MATPPRMVGEPPEQSAQLNQNARTVIEKRYLVKDASGKAVEQPETMFWRVATTVAEADRRYGAGESAVDAMAREFYGLMTERRFEPNSPTLMNAGRPLGQLSACFVLPVEDALSNGQDGIYDTLRSMALIHQSGGGCVAADARVWTTFCGVEPIEVLFNRATVDGRRGSVQGGGTAYDVRDLDIRTLSMDPETGRTALRPVTHVWKFDVAAESQLVVRTREGTEVQTSDWHPFMVLRGTRLEEVRADALRQGDVILGPERPDAYWPWDETRTVGGLTIDADLAWLIGFTLGDGSFGYVPALRQHRVRWFSGTEDVLDRVRAVLARRDIHVSIQRDPRGRGLVLATLAQEFVHALRQACALAGRGPKDAIIRVPEHIGKAPLPVVRAFVAGLLDSDGCVDVDGSPSYSTASEDMAQDLAALVSLLGYQPTVRRKEPYGRGKLPTYTVLLCPLPQVDQLATDIAPFMSNALRKGRLRSDSTRQTALALPIAPWRAVLRAHGLLGVRGRKSAGPCADVLNRWSCNENGRVNRGDLAHLANALEAHDRTTAALLRRAARNAQEVVEVARAETPKPYYDLTVAEWNTYAAGRNGMMMIHNTGFSFSRLRGKGSMVRSTTGVASGPVSFMKLYDASTDAVKQGGCVAPDTLVSTNRGVVPIRELGPTDGPADSWHAHAAPLRVATDAGEQASDEFYVHGVAAVRRIRTKSGYHLAATHRHRVRVIAADGRYVWRRFDELNVGDWVVLQKGHLLEADDVSLPALATRPHPNATAVRLPTQASELFGEFVGYLVGDGAFNRYNTGGGTWRMILTVCDEQPDVAAWLGRTCEALFGVRPIAQKKPGDASTNYFLNATTLGNWLAQLGVSKLSAADACVPDLVFRKGVAFARGFLRGLFTADGTVSTDGYPSLSSVSPTLIDGVQQLLLGVGVPSATSVVTDRASAFGDRPLHRLRVTTRAGLDVFAQTIGFLDAYRASRLSAGLDGAWERNDVIPHQGARLREAYAGPGRGSGARRGSRGADRALYRDIQHYLPDAAEPRHLTRSRLAVLAEKHTAIRNSEALTWFLAHDQFYDQIESIEEGESLTLDLSVPANNTYVANGFVSHNTRRGANMGILRVDHPDILDFISCKEDLTQITNFNISVAVTTVFMEAVKAGSEYDLIDPASGAVAGRLDARMVWDRMIEGAWRTGEPGCFFIDEANRYNPVPRVGLYEATNPCLIGATRLATDRGLLTLDELHREVMEIRVVTDNRVPAIREQLAGGGVAVRSRRGTTLRYAVPVFRTRENAPVYKLGTSHGYEVTATDNHKFFTPSGLVELKNLVVGDTILLQSGEGAWSTDYALPPFEPTGKLKARVECGKTHLPRTWSRELGQLLGWAVADGWTSEETPEGRHVPNFTVGFLFGGDERPLAEAFRARIRHWTGLDGNLVERPGRAQLMYKSALYYFLHSLGLNTPGEAKRVPASLWRAPREAVIGFLQAMFTADGTVNISAHRKTCSVRLASSDPALMREVQQLLLNLGVVSKLYPRRPAHDKLMPDGRGGQKMYACLAQYELVLDKENRDTFVRTVGFISTAKQQKAERWLAQKQKRSNRESFATRVVSLERAGAEDVYCTTEFVTHSIVANGFVTAQCGEQPLGPYDVCNLGSINVGLYVRDGVMDWNAMQRDVHLSTHFLDNIIDVNKYPLPEIDALSKRIRRIGFGIMGFADALVRLGIPYDSPEGIAFGRTLQQFVDTESRRESERLANERGPFPEWARSIWGPDETCARDAAGNRIRPMQMLRNCNVTTVAPTGTISIIAGCSSGIEPLFAVAFMRNQAGAMMPDVNEDFVAIAKREGWYSEELVERIAREGHIHFDEVPEKWQRVFVTAHDITPEWHVRMQAAFQEHCDSAISKTTNFPHAATRDDVRAIYELAYDLKCKGVTVYRDGSRDNQVLSTGATEQARAEREGKGEARRELGELQGEVTELNSEIERLRKALFDVEAENLQRRAKRARPDKLRGTSIRKETPLGTMFVHITEDDLGQPFEVFINLGKAGGAAMADAEAVGRLISLALRSGIPMREVHRQLRGISSDRAVGLGPNKVLSLPDAIGIALEDWLRDKQGVQQDLLGGQSAGGASQGTQVSAPPVAQRAPVAQPEANNASAQLGFDAYTGADGFMQTCPDCSSQLEFAEGCAKCHVCGFSECG